MFNLKFQETCGSYNGCSKGLKDKFVERHRPWGRGDFQINMTGMIVEIVEKHP